MITAGQQRPKMCIDRPIPFYLDEEACKVAIAENPENAEEPQDSTS